MQKYQYKCIAAANADEEDLYGVINKLKGLYPEIVENNNAPPDSEFLRRKFWQGQKRVMVQYSFSERSVTVFSEDWLEKFYEDREVTEGRFKPIASMSANIKFTIILSIIFAALNFSSLLLIAGIVEFRLWIIYSALSVIYIISAFIIKSKWEISEFKILFIQLGGYITIADCAFIKQFDGGSYGLVLFYSGDSRIAIKLNFTLYNKSFKKQKLIFLTVLKVEEIFYPLTSNF